MSDTIRDIIAIAITMCIVTCISMTLFFYLWDQAEQSTLEREIIKGEHGLLTNKNEEAK